MRFRSGLCVVVAALLAMAASRAGAAGLEGRYASSNTGNRTAVIAVKDGIYTVLLTVKSRLCTGELEAIGEVKGGTLVAEVTGQDDPCKVTISRRGRGIAVREQRCLNWHGAACDFNGELAPR
jgi:hypothetical protein